MNLLPDLSVLWVIVFVLLLATILNVLLFKPLMRVMDERATAVASARRLAEEAGAHVRVYRAYGTGLDIDTREGLEFLDRRRVAEAMLQGGEWARSLMAPPATPADRVAILRAAHEKAAKDPDLLAEAKKLRIEITHLRGEHLQSTAKEVMTQPPEVVEQIKKLFVQ